MYTLRRISKRTDVTLGVLLDPQALPIMMTLEMPDKNNQPRISCIPEGFYTCLPYTSAKFPNVWELQNVPNRSKILIHSGNTVDDILGCILVGLRFGSLNGKPAVLDSKLALDKLRKLTASRKFELAII